MIATGLIVGLVALTFLLAAFWVVPKLRLGNVVFDSLPDIPKPFGYKMSWLAVRTEDTDGLVRMLGLVAPEPSNWNSGIGAVYDDQLSDYQVFVTPPVRGWTFVIGLSLPHPVGESLVDKLTPLLVNLGNRFGDVQYFFSYPLIDFFAWARGTNGRVVRAFAISDEGVIWNRGRITQVEKELGLTLFELRGVRSRSGDAGGEMVLYPTEEHVMRVAADWGLDPSTLDKQEALPALGVVGIAPSAWRAARANKGQKTGSTRRSDNKRSAA